MIDHTLSIKQLQNLEELYIIYSGYTKMPFVECDPETFDDQIHVFSEEADLQEFAKAYTDKKILLIGKKCPKAQAPGIFASLYGMGINSVIFHNHGTTVSIPLEKLVKKPDLKKLQEEPLPIINPTLTLSAAYFLQELHRPVEHDMKMLKELEDEMIANLVRSRYILGMMTANPDEKFDPKNPNQPKRVHYVKDKEGQIFLPMFADISEFTKFHKKNAEKLGMAVVTFDKLPTTLMKEAKGIVLNPAGFGLQILKEQLDQIVAANFITEE